jgi:hypothetical protein
MTPVSEAAAAVVAAAGLPDRAQKRRRAPKIDIDAAISRYQEEVKRAAKLMQEARRQARNERRKKQRLMKKASSLTSDDLERIAVLKRCGLWAPGEPRARDERAVAVEEGVAADVELPGAEPAAVAAEPAAPATPTAADAHATADIADGGSDEE